MLYNEDTLALLVKAAVHQLSHKISHGRKINGWLNDYYKWGEKKTERFFFQFKIRINGNTIDSKPKRSFIAYSYHLEICIHSNRNFELLLSLINSIKTGFNYI